MEKPRPRKYSAPEVQGAAGGAAQRRLGAGHIAGYIHVVRRDAGKVLEEVDVQIRGDFLAARLGRVNISRPAHPNWKKLLLSVVAIGAPIAWVSPLDLAYAISSDSMMPYFWAKNSARYGVSDVD